MTKYALITGASGGIGGSIAEKLARSGYSLYLHYNKNEEKINNLKKKLAQYPVQIETIQADLSNPLGASYLIDMVNNEVDTIVHNCGKSIYGLVTDLDIQTIQQQIQLQLTSPILITKSLLPAMISRKQGHIIFITSIWGQTGASCEVLYSSLKGAQNTFVKALAKEVAPSGIMVNGIAPGAIQTNMLNQFTQEEVQQLKDDIPLGRFGTPTEIAETVSFLISDKASYITGQILAVNGGWYC
jgi:3-oxoacyl-[acyl-carrier protein] reductase